MKSKVVLGENQFLEVAKEKTNWSGISKRKDVEAMGVYYTTSVLLW